MGFAFRDVRPYQGRSIAASSGFQSIPLGTSHDFVNITGQGALRYVHFLVSAVNDSHKIWPIIKCDGVSINPNGLFDAMSARGYSENTTPYTMTLYAADGDIFAFYTFMPELPFEVSLQIYCENWSPVNAVSVSCAWTYYTT